MKLMLMMMVKGMIVKSHTMMKPSNSGSFLYSTMTSDRHSCFILLLLLLLVLLCFCFGGGGFYVVCLSVWVFVL